MRRRRYLALAVAILAGCSDSGESTFQSPEETESDGPTDTPASKETATETATESETATAASSGTAQVASQEFVIKEGDYSTEYAVTGTINNVGDGTLSYVEVTAKFFDSGGNQIGSTMTNFLALAPGETWETWVPYFDDSGEPADGEFVISDTSQWPSGAWPDDVTLQNHSLEPPKDEYSGPRVVGTAKNETGNTLDYLEADAKFYAENGNVLNSGYTNVTELADGDTWRFEIEFTSYNDEWSDRVSSHKVRLTTSP